MITTPKVALFLVLVLTILSVTLAVNWGVFEIFKKISERLSGNLSEHPHLTMTAPAIIAAIINFLLWLIIFSLVF